MVDAASEATPTEPAVESQPARPERQARTKLTLQGAFDLVRTLRAQNREAEIPPEALGLVRAYDADVISRSRAEDQQERAFRDRYVELLATRASDPARFGQGVTASDLQFMEAYGRQHPEVTLDNPEVAPRPVVDPVQMRQAVDSEYRSAFADFAAGLAEDFEIPVERFGEIQAKGQGPFGVMNDLVQTAIQRGIEAGIAKELPRRLAEEAKAIRLEEQARYAGRTIITPRMIPNGTPALAPSRDASAPLSMREAAIEAQRILETA